jgi:hypothetical protein
MSSTTIVRYLAPWKYKRELERQQRLTALRQRDGDSCRRCRRALRFDLPEGHDLGPKIECIATVAEGETPTLGDLCLTHRRCHAESIDHTAEVKERIRRKAEAELLSKSRRRRPRAA